MKTSTTMRTADLVANASRLLAFATRRGKTMNISQLLLAALSRQPKMHYIDFDTASRKLHAIERRGLEAVVRTPLAQQQWAELRDQVAEAMSTRRRLSFVQALTFVLHFRRPSRFYIAPNSAFKILNRHFRPSLVEVVRG